MGVEQGEGERGRAFSFFSRFSFFFFNFLFLLFSCAKLIGVEMAFSNPGGKSGPESSEEEHEVLGL